ncbi:hypothetical protein N7492_004887 [Penicillium capsulatum]|uniref:Complex 1 LYR protein domain-containing protein n=1 Tax=Penicillium capsulatum TaxID=69766 RepID=A0A9W9IAN5_9EURO|nr:hypothetical protein N7492_004887 [Penicillium capsulatum]KAJ6136005.1 hypothetical protein N7512_001165 [Penicillium capsulatum]
MARLSGLQRDVLSLYRKCLREIRSKPAVSRGYTWGVVEGRELTYRTGVSSQFPTICPVSAEFQKHRSVHKKDFGAIEYLLRKGQRQLEMYASPGIRNIR